MNRDRKNMKKRADKRLSAFLYVFIVYILMMPAPVYANLNNDFNTAETKRDQIVKNYNNKFDAVEKSSYDKISRYKQYISSIKQNTVKRYYPQAIHLAPKALIFASFGMPQLLLKQTIKDGKNYHVPVVMRGLYDNSFKKTAERIFDLVKSKNAGGILIDPVWFRRFDIKAVPAVVVQNPNTNQYDIIYGNIPLKRALEIIKEKGDAGDIASEILENGDA